MGSNRHDKYQHRRQFGSIKWLVNRASQNPNPKSSRQHLSRQYSMKQLKSIWQQKHRQRHYRQHLQLTPRLPQKAMKISSIRKGPYTCESNLERRRWSSSDSGPMNGRSPSRPDFLSSINRWIAAVMRSRSRFWSDKESICSAQLVTTLSQQGGGEEDSWGSRGLWKVNIRSLKSLPISGTRGGSVSVGSSLADLWFSPTRRWLAETWMETRRHVFQHCYEYISENLTSLLLNFVIFSDIQRR